MHTYTYTHIHIYIQIHTRMHNPSHLSDSYRTNNNDSDAHFNTFIDRIITEYNIQSGNKIPEYVRSAIVSSSVNNNPPIKKSEQDIMTAIKTRIKQFNNTHTAHNMTDT